MSSLRLLRPAFLLRPPAAALLFAARVLATALLALLAALLLGLENPHWAAMTTIVVAQPTRGAAFVKGFYRVVGSIVGAIAGVAILRLLHPWPPALVMALALWVGACVGAANLLGGFRYYGAVLAALTCPLVTLMAFDQPGGALALGITRIAEVLVGIVVSSVVAALLLPELDRNALLERARLLTRNILDWAIRLLEPAAAPQEMLRPTQPHDDAEVHRLAMELAELDQSAAQAAATAPRFRSRLQAVGDLMASLLSLIAVVRSLHGLRCGGLLPGTTTTGIAAALAIARNGLAHSPPALGAARTALDAQLAWEPGIGGSADELARTLAALETQLKALETQPVALAVSPSSRRPIGHRDWVAARIAALRALIAISLVGALWQVTGWAGGGPMLMTAAIMCAIFAIHPMPIVGVRGSLVGAALAFTAAIAFRLVVLPEPTPVWWELLWASPLLFAGLLAIANRPTMFAGTDFCMMFLFMAEPGSPWLYPASHLLTAGSGIVLGVAIATLVYAFILPTSHGRRLQSLQREMIRDVERIAGASVLPAPGIWRMRALHRLLRLTWRTGPAAAPAEVMIGAGMACVTIGSVLLELLALQSDPALPALRPLLTSVLGAAQELGGHPEQVAAAARAALAELDDLPAAADTPQTAACRAALGQLALATETAQPFCRQADGW